MDEKLLKKLKEGAQKILKNAVELYREAVLLAENQSWSRALFLHQISMEECAKVEVLGGNAASLLMGGRVNFKKMAEVFRSHETKNRVNAYFLKPSIKEKTAQRSGRVADAIAAFELVQDHFHALSNLEKNAALYVDLQGEEFKGPGERITPRMVARIGKQNEKFLYMSAQKVELLQNYERDPARYVKQAAQIKATMEKIEAENRNDPGKAAQAFIDTLLAKVGK